jgi:sigma-B regulation protein RsbU (phosphoserine phosphatase)
LEIDARYLAAQKVSGDYYDIFPLGPTQVGAVVADVSGKGIPASLLMAICRTNLRQIATRHESPAASLIELNEALGQDIRQGMFITLLYAVIDTLKNEVTFARAGHELPFILRGADSNGAGGEFVGSEGLPIGLVPNDIFSTVIVNRTETFRTGDLLVLYTDGLTESPNEDDKEFAGPRLADAVRSLRSRNAREINDGILESVQRFAGPVAQRDDLTLMTIKRL